LIMASRVLARDAQMLTTSIIKRYGQLGDHRHTAVLVLAC
jgi:hypothetical protein